MVDIGLFEAPGQQLEVRVRPNGAGYDGVVTALTFTIRWESSSGALLGGPFQVIGGNSCPAETLPIQPSPDGQVDAGGFRYLNFNGFGFVPLSGCAGQPGYSWPADVWTPVMRVPVQAGTGCAAFRIVNDAYTEANNQDFYLSLFGAERNGAIAAGPVYVEGSAGGCDDCSGTPGGQALPGSPCDDGDDCTLDDRYDAQCACIGLPLTASFTTPAQPIVVGVAAQFQSTSTPGAVLSWAFGDGATSNEAAPQHTWQAPGPYTVSLQAGNGSCMAEVETVITVQLPTGVDGIAAPHHVQAWVSDGLLWLRVPPAARGMRYVDLYDPSGRRLAQHAIGPDVQHALPLPKARGLVMLRLREENGDRILRLVLP